MAAPLCATSNLTFSRTGLLPTSKSLEQTDRAGGTGEISRWCNHSDPKKRFGPGGVEEVFPRFAAPSLCHALFRQPGVANPLVLGGWDLVLP